MANNNQQQQRTASQRIEDLERGLVALYQTADNMARDMMTIKEAIKLLGNKVDAIVKASNRGEQMTDEVISAIMVENNVSELKEKVDNLVTQGILVPAKDGEVKMESFIVGREIDEDGKIQNPRMQFVVSALAEKVRDKFPGAKVGQTLTIEEGKYKFEIQEAYDIVTPQAPEAAPAQEEAKQEASEETKA